LTYSAFGTKGDQAGDIFSLRWRVKSSTIATFVSS